MMSMNFYVKLQQQRENYKEVEYQIQNVQPELYFKIGIKERLSISLFLQILLNKNEINNSFSCLYIYKNNKFLKLIFNFIYQYIYFRK